MGWRDIRASARAIVHGTMQVPAKLMSGLGSNATDLGDFNVRVHDKQAPLGTQPGTDPAERLEAIPKIVFWRADLTAASVTLDRNMVISVTDGEAYNIELVEPHDIETVKVQVTRLDAGDAAGLPLPG